ncbi:hypothetical protein [Streptomyces sp. NPDC058751]|uniref:hypothetical protein n=1 Tax=Streptomyces sp. NPDC058751 TaxID=3346623 RepID=UPI0036756A5F
MTRPPRLVLTAGFGLPAGRADDHGTAARGHRTFDHTVRGVPADDFEAAHQLMGCLPLDRPGRHGRVRTG